MPENPRHILWLRTDSIGDNVLSASMLPHVRRFFGGAALTVVCQSHIAELYETCPHVDRVITFDKKRACADEEYKAAVIETVRGVGAGLCLNSAYSREPLTDDLALNSGADEIIAFDGDFQNGMTPQLKSRNNPRYTRIIESPHERLPELERHREFLHALGGAAPCADGMDVPPLSPLLWLSPADEAYADVFFADNAVKPERALALFPGAQHHHKVYGGYDAVLAFFKDYDVLILGGDGEREISARLSAAFAKTAGGGRAFDLAGRTTLRQTAALIRRCRAYVGADSAGAHMACAVGAPNVVVLGGGHFGRFFPYSPLTSVVCLPLECYGCGWVCGYDAPHCTASIRADIVAVALRQAIETAAPKPHDATIPPHDAAAATPRVYAQGASLWNPPADGPRWAWFSRMLNPDTVTLLPFGDVPPIGLTQGVARPLRHVVAPPLTQGAACDEQYREAGRDEKYQNGKYLVTAIVSTYNSAEFIGECLEDLVNQSIAGRLEIIVVDAASPQDERSVAAEFQRNNANITYIRTGGRIGIYAAWNMAARLAQGKYLISVSTNDRLRRDACEILSQALEENPEAALAYGDSVLTESPHQSFENHTPCGRYRWPEYSFEDALKNCRVGPHPMWRRSVHDTVGYFDESYAAIGDQEMWLRIGEVFPEMLHVPEVTGLYWVSPEAVSRKGQAPHIEIYDIYRKYQKRYILSIKRRVAADGFKTRPTVWSKAYGGRFMGWVSAAGIAASSRVFGRRPLLVWGAGEGGRVTLEMLASTGVHAWGFIDSDLSKRGRRVSGVTVHGPAILGLLERLGRRPYVVIASMYAPKIRGILDARGYGNRVDYWINIFELGHARNL
jgi:ADP-heptose:LPS heptosyltransferase/glycosyltransferase involved in cell wall biosynthesis